MLVVHILRRVVFFFVSSVGTHIKFVSWTCGAHMGGMNKFIRCSNKTVDVVVELLYEPWAEWAVLTNLCGD